MTAKPYVINKGGGNSVEVLLYDQIGESLWSEGITAKTFAKDLQSKGKLREINVRINSPGGSVFDGLAIYNTLKQSKATVNVFIDGMALSIASVIAMAGDNISMAQNALMMIHNPQGAVAGSSSDMRKYADMLDKVRDAIVSSYRERTQLDDAELIEMLDNETWMTAEEAIANGFADDTTEELAMAASFDMPSFVSVPSDMADLITRRIPEREPEMQDELKNESAEPVKPVSATIEQLKALPGVDAEFIVDQLSAEASLDQAKDALLSSLVGKLQAVTEHAGQLQDRLTQRDEEPEVTATADPVDIGCEPLESNSAGGDVTPWGGDVKAFHQKLMRELLNEGLTAAQAFERIAKDYPELNEELYG